MSRKHNCGPELNTIAQHLIDTNRHEDADWLYIAVNTMSGLQSQLSEAHRLMREAVDKVDPAAQPAECRCYLISVTTIDAMEEHLKQTSEQSRP